MSGPVFTPVMTQPTITLEIFARLTDQGTAAADTAVCTEHKGKSDVTDDAAGDLVECTDNDMLACVECGWQPGHDDCRSGQPCTVVGANYCWQEDNYDGPSDDERFAAEESRGFAAMRAERELRDAGRWTRRWS